MQYIKIKREKELWAASITNTEISAFEIPLNWQKARQGLRVDGSTTDEF